MKPPPLTPDEMYGVAKHKAVTLSLMLEQMSRDERISEAHRGEFMKAMSLVEQSLCILRDVPFVEGK